MVNSTMIKTNQRTPIGEMSFILGLIALLLTTTATIMPRMALTDVHNVKTSWGIWRKSEGDTSSTEQIQCSDFGGASRGCIACQAFSIISIGTGLIGLAASIRVHEIFADLDQLQSTLLLFGAGVSSLLVFAIFEASVINGEAEDNPLHNAPRKESFVLFVLSWLLFWASAVAFYMSEEIEPEAAS